MNLTYASNPMSEKNSWPSLTAGLASGVQAASTAHLGASLQLSALPPAPISVLVLDHAGCVKTLNSAAQALLGDLAVGQAWPLLRSATFKREQSSSLLSASDGTCYLELPSTEASGGGRIICLQVAAVPPAHSDALVTLGEGLAKLVHQMRTPLTAASLYLDQLTRQLSHEPKLQRLSRKPADQLHSVESIVSGALGLLQPVTIDSGELKVSGLMARLEEQCAPVVLLSGAHLYCAPVAENLYVKADLESLLSALSNLVINAAQHPAKGRLLRVCVVVRCEADALVFEVSDTGKGVPEEAQRKVFNAFESTRSGGTGLGLFIARSIFSRFDGTIDLENNAEGGATFSVRFPAEAINVAA